MIVADAAFLPDRFYGAAARAAGRALTRLRTRESMTSSRRVPVVPRQPGDSPLGPDVGPVLAAGPVPGTDPAQAQL
jgi:hypothetical protein